MYQLRFNIDLDFNNLKFSQEIRFINYLEKTFGMLMREIVLKM